MFSGRRRRLIALIAIALVALLTSCSSPVPPSTTTPSTTQPGPTAPATCHLTVPDPAFVAPSPYPGQPPATYRSAWFGTPALWTMLRSGGEVWSGLPRDKVGYTQKTFWWSAAWDPAREPEPAISVAGRQLDGPATFTAGDPGTNAGADFGEAMLVGVVLPSPGCWQLTARYRGAELSYVVWVDGN